MSTLEQQIYSIEAANINKETLLAMDNAQKAMAQIHDKLDINKVDEIMYVFCLELRYAEWHTDLSAIGIRSENNMLWERKLHRPSQTFLLARLSMNPNWMTNWPSLNRSSSTTRCSKRALFQYPTRFTGYLRLYMERVSSG